MKSRLWRLEPDCIVGAEKSMKGIKLYIYL